MQYGGIVTIEETHICWNDSPTLHDHTRFFLHPIRDGRNQLRNQCRDQARIANVTLSETEFYIFRPNN